VQSVAHRQHHAATDGEQQRGGHEPQLDGVRVCDKLQRSTHHEWHGWPCLQQLDVSPTVEYIIFAIFIYV